MDNIRGLRSHRIIWQGTVFERQAVRKASWELRQVNFGFATCCIVFTVIFINFLVSGDNTSTVAIMIYSVISVIGIAASVIFLLLVLCLYHNERATARSHILWLQPYIKYCPSAFTSLKSFLPIVLFCQAVRDSPTHSVHDAEDAENQNVQPEAEPVQEVENQPN